MSQNLLEIKNLSVEVEDKVILEDINLTINKGETHVLMGQNGTGKSTLVSTIMGDPRYKITKGQIIFEGVDLTKEPANVRAKAGIFMSFQNPQEVPGITLENFLRTSKGALTGKMPGVIKFQREMRSLMKELNMDESYAERYLNVGFSGGEKKKAEILQMLMSDPKLALLDETDSGLDVDAVRIVSEGINRYHNENNAILIITHATKIIESLDIDHVHVLGQKTIIKTGGPEIIDTIINEGFQALNEMED